MPNRDDDLSKKLTVIVKHLYILTRHLIENLKDTLLKAPQQRKAYGALNGKRTIKEIAQLAGYATPRQLETLLLE